MATDVVIVGGGFGAGYAGLERIAELQDYVAGVIDRYPRCGMAGARFVLVEAREREGDS